MESAHTICAGNYFEGSFFMAEQLAIVSIPKQTWNEVYDEKQAFACGTIFPELNRPFFVTVLDRELDEYHEKMETSLDREQSMLLQIQKVGFMLDDLRLYMDTHPEDKEGLHKLKELVKKKKKLMYDFTTQFYPLTADCMADIYEMYPESECYCWINGRIPWEGACK